MPIKTFDSIADLSEYYGSEIFRSIDDDTLFVFDNRQYQWLRYRWSQGRREVRFVEAVAGGLPIVTQVYPARG
ncbi:MAG: hypothetical protein WBO46_02680 [Caldilineaceae bacterium]